MSGPDAARETTVPGEGGARPRLPHRPGKVVGIGLNYRAHAGDLDAALPVNAPVSFFKAEHTWIGDGEPIAVPDGVGRVTAEAELGLVIGRPCREVTEGNALDHVSGACAVLDQTAEEELLKNPRYLSFTKNYATFFAFGPRIMPISDVLARTGDLSRISVSTVLNGTVQRQDTVAGMLIPPARLIAFLSHVMPLEPGDVISTGTPGAVPIKPGDEVAAVLDGIMTLRNPVVRGGRGRPAE
ncbi:fumarylacetoacetate hydrolase family protein [Actinomadura roseirufa]|uniref:fumarylacetoacetate hydrolase family protein n=1 Tax=Actinomadura roseirufa TaxID=2094049 RepID=UPI00104197E5|nr:fumarylacetoacetate hydrolase family protein [Actinomadura roseirufa]